VSLDRAEAMAVVAAHCSELFDGGAALRQPGDDYAVHDVVVPDPAPRAALTRFFGDTVFLAGVAAFAWLMTGLWFGWSDRSGSAQQEVARRAA
jgi:hypothetical protein